MLLVSVTARSTSGGVVRSWWPQQTGTIAMALAGAAVVGKILGGFLADRIGWRTVGAGALLLVAPLVWLMPHFGQWGIAVSECQTAGLLLAGTLLIQMTMAVTLTGVYVAMPKRSGLAFGLPSLALLIGSPQVYKHFVSFSPADLLTWMILASAALIFVGLTLINPVAASGKAR